MILSIWSYVASHVSRKLYVSHVSVIILAIKRRSYCNNDSFMQAAWYFLDKLSRLPNNEDFSFISAWDSIECSISAFNPLMSDAH